MLREKVSREHRSLKEQELATGPRASHGYGGKFGVEQGRMDKVSRRPAAWPALSAHRRRPASHPP